jgi:HSP20 family molecular chaperone IbpA
MLTLQPHRSPSPVEEYVADGQYVVRADLPGMEHDEHRSELRYGSFTPRLRLPHSCRARR